MIPATPRRPSTTVNNISAEWINQLLDNIEFLKRNLLAPDNRTIFATPTRELFIKPTQDSVESEAGAPILWVRPSSIGQPVVSNGATIGYLYGGTVFDSFTAIGSTIGENDPKIFIPSDCISSGLNFASYYDAAKFSKLRIDAIKTSISKTTPSENEGESATTETLTVYLIVDKSIFIR